MLACLVIELIAPPVAAAPGEGGTWPLGDLDLLDREGLARSHARIAQPVDKHVRARLVAADDVAVAEGVAVLARAHGDPDLVVEHVAQVRLARFLELLLGDDGDGGGRFGQRLHAPRIARDLRLVGRAGLRIGVGVGGVVLDLQRLELDLLALLSAVLILRLGGQGKHRSGHAEREGAGRPAKAGRPLDTGSACHLH